MSAARSAIRRIAAILGLALAVASAADAQTASRDLGGTWTLRAAHAGIGPVPARVPGSVHRALVDAGRLADPLVGAGEAAAAWVDTTMWVFETTFPGGDPATGRAPVRPHLVFEGLDTFADIDLNGVRVASSASMFVPLDVDVTGALVPGENRLRVTFHPALREAARRAAAHPFALPESPRVFARKAQYSFGWDWGPKLVGAGIWRGVRLDDADAVRIEAVAAQIVRLRGPVRPDGTTDADVRLSVDVAPGRRGVASVDFTLDGQRVATRTHVRLSGTRQTVTADVRLPHARLWWPRGHGSATTLPLRVDVQRGDDAATLTQRIGLRTVALDTAGGAFAFVVNGRRVFARGANAVPLAPFYPVDEAVAARVLGSAADANMNMVRIWGGGVFESDRTYDLADSLGLMVWQDFPFASAFYPGDDDFVATVEREADAAVRRLRRHPSVVLWCGGNEIWEGWTNWGWQRSLGYSAEDSALVGAAYGRIFERTLGSVVRENGAGVPYWANSPSTGWGREAAYRRGDVHYWGVWWGREPFERYRERVGRFHSEYGMQGYPVWATVRDFAGVPSSGILSEDDATFASHQKHPTGFATLREYARQTFLPDTLALDRLRRDDLPAYAFVTQAMQAEGIGLAVAAHRAGAPRTMGTLVWQLNDVWPVVSWSSVDVYGRWKPLHHRLAGLYRPLFADLVPEPNGGSGESGIVRAIVHSDTVGMGPGGALALVLAWDAYDSRSGARVGSGEVPLAVRPNAARVVDLGPLPADTPRSALLVRLCLREPGTSRVLLDARATAVVPWRLDAPRAAPTIRAAPGADGRSLVVSSDVPVVGVWLEAPSGETLRPNYLDLWPGEPVRVALPPGVAPSSVTVRSVTGLLVR